MLLPVGFRYWRSLLCLLGVAFAPGQISQVLADSPVVITEIASAPPYRLLKWDADPPRLGVGPAWTEPSFDDSAWSKGQGPFGFGYPGIATDVGSLMTGRTPSLYLRCVFSLPPGVPLDATPLRCLLRYDDGFVATLNGREVARANLGPAGMFIPARHPAFNVRTSAEPVAIDLGPASHVLNPGPNLLTLQVHNTWPLTEALPHDPTLLADVRLLLGDLQPLELVGPQSSWRWFVGISEPSGAFRDPDLAQPGVDPPAEADEFHDWIEIQNRGSQEVDLGGWSLSDDAAAPSQWIFPKQRLAPGSRLVVFCSGLDRRSPASGYLHTNFRLNREGEALTLRRPDGTLASGFLPSYPPLDQFHSYGIDEATGVWGYFPEPTPGQANRHPLLLGRTEPVTIHPKAGFYPGDVPVEFHCPSPFTRIRYTLDGSEPSMSNGFDYTNRFLVTTSTTVRARAFRRGWIPSEVATATYLVRVPSELTAMPALVLSGSPSRTFFAPQGVVTVTGGTYVGAFQDEIWIAGSPDDYNMYLVSGPAAERPACVEILNPGGASAGPWDCGLRVSSSIWSTPRMIMPPGGDIIWNHDGLSFRIKPSFGLFFRGEYGLDQLQHPLFEGPGGARFEDLRLRAGKNDWANPFIRDELIRRLFGQMGQPTSRGLLVNLFINGQFKSYYNLVERLRNGFLQSRTGGTAGWDILNPNEIAEGDDTRWKADEAFLLAGSLADPARYQEASRRFDVVNVIDYALLNLYCATSDWPENNWVLARERTESGQWQFLVWDAESSFGFMSPKTTTHDTVSIDLLATNSPQTVVARIFSAFHSNPEFRLLFADRAQRHLFGAGALTETNVLREAGVLQRLAEPSVQFVRAESLKTGYLGYWVANRPAPLLQQLAARSLWPAVPAPHILLPASTHTSLPVVPAEARLGASAPGDEIIYTLDGSDPRAPGGAIAGIPYSEATPIPLSGSTRIQARTRRGLDWSPLASADFHRPAPEGLRLTEIHYEPPGTATVDGRAFEFVELHNASAHAVPLDSVAFTEGIQFAFPAGSSLGPGAYAVVVADADAFRTRYPEVSIAGVYSGRLDNAGETVALTYQRTNVLVRLTYNNKSPWPPLAAGQGFSLVPSESLNFPPADSRAWRHSSLPGGSPGRADDPPVSLPIVFNEVSPRPPPGQPWWIEFRNPTLRAVDMSHWWLTDNPAQPRKYQFPEGTILPPGGLLLVDATEIALLPTAQQLRLSPGGGHLVLFAADSNDQWLGGTAEFVYEAVPEGASFGRTPDDSETEHLVTLVSASPDHENGPYARVRVAIQEIALATHAGDLEFIEIANLTDQPVPLFEPDRPLRPWRLNGLDYRFPPQMVLEPGEILVVCAADPEVFRAQREVPSQVRVLGPWSGKLDPDGETLRLERPDPLPTGETLFLAEDRVRFRTAAPWPRVQTTGHSLQRRDPAGIGDSPDQWVAELATPGRPNGPTASRPTVLRMATPRLGDTVVAGDSVAIEVSVDTSPISAGLVQSLTLYANDAIVGTSPGTNATFLWTPESTQVGPVEWRAVATTEDGAELASERMSSRVLASQTSETVLVPSQAPWKILRTLQPLAPAWSSLAFDDTAWTAVPGPVDARESSMPDAFTYLRYSVDLSSRPPSGSYHLQIQAGPGALVFLNEHPVAEIDGGGEAVTTFAISAQWLRPGTNLFAVLLPPNAPTASPPPFFLELSGTETVIEPWIHTSPADLSIAAGAPATLAVRAAGSPLFLRWFQTDSSGQTRLLDANTPVLALPSVTVSNLGTYFVVASNRLGSATSTVARLSLLPPDADGDGMPDAWETHYGLDPHDPSDAAADADADFASNLEEYLAASNPTRAPGDPEVVISEIMYRPASANPNHEFIELLNPGTAPVPLEGWQFTRGIQYALSNLVLQPGARLVIAAEPSLFAALYPGVTNVVGPWTGTLANSGETLELVDGNGRTVDQVRYANEGDWARRRRAPVSVEARGWEWFAEHDGLGKSLELIQPGLSNDSGQNWDASRVPGGTPGAPNSVATTDLAPLVSGVETLPPTPRPGSPVRILATLADEQDAGVQAQVFYRRHQEVPPPPFTAVPMADDGLHGDGLAGDSVWAADLPPQPDGAVVEYYIATRDSAGNERTWPAPALDENLAATQVDNALYLVATPDDTRARPRFRLIMTETERQAHVSADRRSSAAFNATLVIEDGINIDVRQRVSVRIRGASTRFAVVPNLRLHIPNDQPWQGVDDINLNTFVWAPSQWVGSVLALNSGVPAARARPIDLYLNATNRATQGAFVQLQVIDDHWARDHFPNDPDGNVYFCRRPVTDLSYQGTNSATYMALGYSKESNREANDWRDLIALTDVLNNTPEPQYAAAVRAVLDPEEWIRYFAFNSLLGNSETSLGSGVGDDYDLYRGIHDPRFLVVAHDLDSLLSFSISMPINTGIFLATAVRSMDRFLKHPEFAPLYFRELDRLMQGPCSPDQVEAVARYWLKDVAEVAVVDEMTRYARLRAEAVRAQIPRSLTVTHSLPETAGYPRTTTPTVALSGHANAITTRSIRVNGLETPWIAWQARWTNAAVPLRPGLNRIVIQAFDENTVLTEQRTQDIWLDDPSESIVPEVELADDATWTASRSPYWVPQTFTVPVGRTLKIEPGTTVYFATNAVLSVFGRLLAEGTAESPIRLSSRPGSAAWGGIGIVNATNENRLRHVVLDNPGPNALRIDFSRALLEGIDFLTTNTCLFFNGASLIIRNCHFPRMAGAEAIIGYGILPGGEFILDGNRFDGTTGYSDLVDFTGAKRPGPILQAYNNIFADGSDDGLDLDGTDAHIEGNVFLRFRRDAARASLASGIATDTSADIVVARNLFLDCDNGVLLKNGARLTSHHNLYLGSLESAIVVGSTDPAILPAAEVRSVGDIFWNNQATFDPPATAAALHLNRQLSVHQSLIDDPMAAGNGNRTGDPRFVNEASDFRLQPGSPAIRSGPNGLDMGPNVPSGVSIAGEPSPVTPATSAQITFGGPGITHYQYQLDDGPFGPEIIPIQTPLLLTNLAPGAHRVAAIGRNSAGQWQSTNAPAVSSTWIVDPALRRLVIHEVLARNNGAFSHHGTTPDAIELHNAGAVPVDLGGIRLTDDPARPDRFVFPAGTTLAPGGYLVVLADHPNGTDGWHLGFSLDGSGDLLELRESTDRGGQLLDRVQFGLQVPDLSLARDSRGQWALGVPTFGASNQTLPWGDPSRLRLSEWLAAGDIEDFVEIHNPDDFPVPLDGVSLTDKPLGWPRRDVFPPLSFLGPGAYQRLVADGDNDDRADHLSFRLSADQGEIAMVASDLVVIDRVAYNQQRPGVSEGRRNPLDLVAIPFPDPTPGAPNRQNSPPSIQWLAPVDRQVVAFPVDLLLEAQASDSDGRVVRVEFYAGTNRIGAVTQEPFRWVWTNAPIGAHRFQARAIDNEGAVSVSAPATIQPITPTCVVAISNAPAPQILNRPTRLSAVISNSPLAVSRVRFYVDETLVAEDATAPFDVPWTPTRGGTLLVRAEARLIGDIPVRSAPVPVVALQADTITVTLVPADAVWRFADPSVTAPTNWFLPNFDDRPWTAGPAPLGYGEGDEATPVPAPPSGRRPVTYYFRHRLERDDTLYSHVTLRLLRDDGAAVYWNGTEILRDNLPPGPLEGSTPAVASLVTADEEDWIVRTLDVSPVARGGNQLAVEIHQHPDSEDDMSLALEVTAQQDRVEPWIIEHPVAASVEAPSVARFEVKALGQPLAYQWYRDGAGPIPGAQSSILTVRGAQPSDVGGYFVVVSNSLGARTSLVAQLAVVAPDSDTDSLPDYWESRFGLNPADPTDAAADLDGDGLSNLEEYRRGFRPLEWDDHLSLSPSSTTLPISQLTLRFGIRALHTARIEMTDSLVPPRWQVLSTYSAAETNRVEEILVPVSASVPPQFFRVVYASTDARNPDPARLVWIPPGTFMMGTLPTEQDRWPQEGPQTRVTLTRGYWMSRFEITQGEYLSLMHTNPAYLPGDLTRPAEWVSWHDAVEYCARRTAIERDKNRIPEGYAYRLPTEAEWEYACRAGTTTRFSFGNDFNLTELDDYAWYTKNSGSDYPPEPTWWEYQGRYFSSHPVGQKRPNAWGLYDMHGNVKEWTSNWYSDSLPGGDAIDPKGPETGEIRTVRGGTWGYEGWFVRVGYREARYPDYKSRSIGFRPVLAPTPP